MKRFLKQRLDFYRQYLIKNQPIINSTGEVTCEINFDFEENSTEFLDCFEQFQNQENEDQKEQEMLKSRLITNSSTNDNLLLDAIKFTDQDLMPFLLILAENTSFAGSINISDHNITDQMAKIISQNTPNINSLSLNKNKRFSYLTGFHIGNALKENKTIKKITFNDCSLGTKGGNRIIEAISFNKQIEEFDFGNLTNASLNYLIQYLYLDHCVKYLAFGEDQSDPWTNDTKSNFLNCLRENPCNKQILSINIYCQNLEVNQNFISEISILCKNNRKAFMLQKNNEYKSKELNQEHSEYYDGDNHTENAFKFSVKTYISNVIETLLDEGLYFLEKEKANLVRDESIFKITSHPINKMILEDLFTADGSILVLARYMIEKIQKDEKLRDLKF